MRRRALEVLACPVCLSDLETPDFDAGEFSEGELACRREAHAFRVVDGIPHMVRPERADRVRAFAESYSKAWCRDGWGAVDSDYLLRLPYRDTSRRRSIEWRVKARSLEALERYLNNLRPHRVADLGSGVGWLSYHLARRGHEVYAVDIVHDNILGLGAATTYLRRGVYFERVLGELSRPPLLDASIDTVICNASLHYATSLPQVVEEINRVLRPGGALVVLNSPVHRDSDSALRAEGDFRERLRRLGADEEVASAYHHFTFDVLGEVLSSGIGKVERIPFDPGLVFRSVRRLKGLVLGMELANFPILLATKQR